MADDPDPGLLPPREPAKPPPLQATPPPTAPARQPGAAETITRLQLEICQRLMSLERQHERTERRLDSLDTRVVALNNYQCLNNMIVSKLPYLKQLVYCMLGVAAAAISLVILGIVIARHFAIMG